MIHRLLFAVVVIGSSLLLAPSFAIGSDDGDSSGIDRYALIVGISEYEDENIRDLNCAARDAEELYKLIQGPTAGAFPKKNICFLTNEKATTAGIIDGLRSFLKRPGPNDVVLMYFSAHGEVAATGNGKNHYLPLVTRC